MQTEELIAVAPSPEKRAYIKVIASNPELLPAYATPGAAGADVKAHLDKDIVIAPGEFRLIPTGLKFEIPSGFEIQVRPRSGLALKYGITVLNTPGTIDSDYRGDVGVILINHGKEAFTVTPLMRIAQIVCAEVTIANFIIKETLSSSERGIGGFGSTGV